MEDVKSVIQEPMIQSSIEKDSSILDKLEQVCIDEVCSYIGGRYDCTKLFGEPPIQNGMIQRIIACIVVYRAVKRNSARKVPEDYVDLNEWAYDILERIRDGGMSLTDVPKIVDPETGKVPGIWINNRREEYFF